MSNRQYIGARYVPAFYEGSNGNNWDPGVSYEPLTVVTYLKESFTSKKPVPNTIGNPAANPDYWAHTGAYNAQVQQYRGEVQQLERDFDAHKAEVAEQITTFENTVNEDIAQFETEIRADVDEYEGEMTQNFNALKSDIDDDISEFKSTVNGQIAAQDEDLTTMSARIDNIASLPEGSTSGDAELQDIRVGYNGYTYLSAGAAVRGQIEDIHNTGLLFKGSIPDNTNIDSFVTIGIYYGTTGGSTTVTGTFPSSGSGEYLLINEGTTNACYQTLVWLNSGTSYTRTKLGSSAFRAWQGEIKVGVDSFDFTSTTAGYFFFTFSNASNVPANFVAADGDYICVHNHGLSEQIFTQDIYNFTTGGFATRNKTGAGWTRITSPKYYHPNYSANIDNLTTKGLYYVAPAYWSGTLPNYDTNDVFILSVESAMEANGTLVACEQTLTKVRGNNQRFVRTKLLTGSWTDWRCVYNNTLGINYPSGTSIDSFTKTGIYYAGGSYLTNGTYPATVVANHTYFVINTGVDGLVYQMLYDLTDNVLSSRTKGGVNWTGWKAIVKAASNVADSMQSFYSGKVANVIGDSIVQMNLWQPTMLTMLDLSEVNNYGVGGCCIASSSLDSQYPPVVSRYGNMDPDADIIIVHAGTNDYSAQIPLGSADSEDTATFNGALNAIMQGLRAMYPNKLIVFNNILSRYTDGNDTQPIKCSQYRDAIRDRCRDNHVLFNDTFYDVGFDFVNERTATDDGLHPNAAGGVILGHEVAGFIFAH